MTMIVSVKPKSGRLASGAYESISPILGSPFSKTPVTTDAPVRQGGVAMTDDRTQSVYQHPNAKQFDTATQPPVDAFTQVAADPTRLVQIVPDSGDTHAVPDIGPHEKGKFFPRKIIPVNKTQFGASSSDKQEANTAFHPVPQKIVPRQKPVSAMQTASKTFLQSFVSNGNNWNDPNNSFIGGQNNATGQGTGSGRWATVKRSVV